MAPEAPWYGYGRKDQTKVKVTCWAKYSASVWLHAEFY